MGTIVTDDLLDIHDLSEGEREERSKQFEQNIFELVRHIDELNDEISKVNAFIEEKEDFIRDTENEIVRRESSLDLEIDGNPEPLKFEIIELKNKMGEIYSEIDEHSKQKDIYLEVIQELQKEHAVAKKEYDDWLQKLQMVVGTTHQENDQIIDELSLDTFEFSNLPEGQIRFNSWQDAHDWAQKEVREWEHWYSYFNEFSIDIRNAINEQRGPIVQLWSNLQNLLYAQRTNQNQIRYLRMANKQIALINQSNPLISYSAVGQEMIKAMDDNPEQAISKYASFFITHTGFISNHPINVGASTITNLPNHENLIGSATIGSFEIGGGSIKPTLNDGKKIPTFTFDATSGKDQLGILKDVNALAKLIAYKDLKPPVSIGLFGAWGSGKSFFMDQIQKRIAQLQNAESRSPDKSYCEQIIHINFNAWHYSDADLWASLVTRIFEGINEQISVPDSSIYEKLQSSNALILEKKEKIILASKHIDDLITKKQSLENAKQDKENQISLANVYGTLVKNIFKRPELQEKLNSISEEVMLSSITSKQDLEAVYNDVSSISATLRKAYQIFLKQKYRKTWIISILFLSIGVYYVTPYIPIIKEMFSSWIASMITAIIGGITLLVPYIKKAKQYVEPLKYVLDRWEEYIADATLDNATKTRSLDQEIHQLSLQVNNLEQELFQQQQQKISLENEISNIQSGKHLIDFIQMKYMSHDYQKHLGIISMIRKDFEELTKLLKEHCYEVKKSGKASKIDRIVLYIDDLDRCSEKTVVQVLDAIHLILAFDLFVVVVGVDSRWMTNALSSQHSALAMNDDTLKKATPFDYLEKIFQIPIQLQLPDSDAKKRLLKYLFDYDKSSISSAKVVVDNSSDAKDHDIPFENPQIKDNSQIYSDAKDEFDPHEAFTISDSELEIIDTISFLIGDTPRTIKRFVNLYRIIRTHEDIPVYSNGTQHVYSAILLLLACVVGQKKIFNTIMERVVQKSLTSTSDLKSLFTDTGNADFQQFVESIDLSSIKTYIQFIARFSFEQKSEVPIND